jgi:VanZ family protein
MTKPLERERASLGPRREPAERPPKRRRYRQLGPWLAWFVFTSLWTASLLTTQPVTVGQKVLSTGLLFLCAKCLHVSAYAAWAMLTGWLRPPRPLRWYVLGFLSAHGFATEYLQHFVPGRHPSWRDVGLDHLGLLIGVACTWKWWRAPNPSHAER